MQRIRGVGIHPHLTLRGLASVALLCLGLPGHGAELRGEARLSQPFPLPADAVLDVQLLEEAQAEQPSVLRGRSRIPARGRSPYGFTLAYIQAAIRPSGRFRLRATIHQADRLLFTTREAVAVLTGTPAPVRLELEPVGDAPLRGLTWLRAPAASVPAPADAARQEQQFRLHPLNHELSGNGDCNRFIGSYTLQEDSLRLEPTGSTMLECEPEVKADEARFMTDLGKVRRWRLDSQGRLELLDQDAQPLLLMETRPL
jgi:putative lipoprotein